MSPRALRSSVRSLAGQGILSNITGNSATDCRQETVQGETHENKDGEEVALEQRPAKRHCTGLVSDSSGATSDAVSGDAATIVKSEESKDVLRDLMAAMSSVPTGEIAWGTGLGPDTFVAPEIDVLGLGPVSTPLEDHQLDSLRSFARETRINEIGTEWLSVPRNPTWLISGNQITCGNPQWKAYLSELVSKARENLGLGDRVLKTRLHGLYVWEKGSLWRNYHCTTHEKSRVGTLLIILNGGYTGGEVAIGAGHKDVYFEPARHSHYLIATHPGVSYDNLPLLEGHRLGLSYELLLPDNDTEEKPSLRALMIGLAQSECALRTQVEHWVAQVEADKLDNFPLIYVLGRNYQPEDHSLTKLSPEDRAKATTVERVKSKLIESYTLQAYLVSVTATSKNYGKAATRRTRYAITRAATLRGDPRPQVKDCVPDERGILQPEGFVDGAVQKKGVAGMNTTTKKMRTCILLVLERTLP
ncbi:hypothetical protein QBC46DRAFT_271860 [Diplogelasinospora grovesii]|uniref:Uncharacterized protein n=1 Tax=Diplogelasinospora grovesii TaxID=303347 RepID=A0AAN6MYS2_9PEZI|nr:hypothetical protein QBC46DRAFT_271860 [Diplogelasinospora grovesii]